MKQDTIRDTNIRNNNELIMQWYDLAVIDIFNSLFYIRYKTWIITGRRSVVNYKLSASVFNLVGRSVVRLNPSRVRRDFSLPYRLLPSLDYLPLDRRTPGQGTYTIGRTTGRQLHDAKSRTVQSCPFLFSAWNFTWKDLSHYVLSCTYLPVFLPNAAKTKSSETTTRLKQTKPTLSHKNFTWRGLWNITKSYKLEPPIMSSLSVPP